MRRPATSGGTRTTGVGPGGAAGGRGLGCLPCILDGRIPEDRLVDLQAAIDDVQEHGLAGRKVHRVGEERVVLGDDVDLARRCRRARRDRRGRGWRGCHARCGDGASQHERSRASRDRQAGGTGRHGAKSRTRRRQHRSDRESGGKPAGRAPGLHATRFSGGVTSLAGDPAEAHLRPYHLRPSATDEHGERHRGDGSGDRLTHGTPPPADAGPASGGRPLRGCPVRNRRAECREAPLSRRLSGDIEGS